MNWLRKISGLWEDMEPYSPNPATRWNEPSNPKNKLPYYLQPYRFWAQFGYSVPSREAIDKIKQFVGNDQVLEIGAGKGLWAKLMQEAGIRVTPTDIASGKALGTNEPSVVGLDNEYYGEESRRVMREEWGQYGENAKYEFDPNTYTEVFRMPGHESIKSFGNDHSVLMLNYPPYNKPLAADMLSTFKGNKLIYIGEGSGGATGDDKFHDLLESWTLIDELYLPNFSGLHATLFLYQR